MATQAFINSIVLLVVSAVLSFMAAWFWFTRNQVSARAKVIADEHQKTLLRLSELEQRVALVNQAVVPISTAFQAILIKELTHFHTPEMDALMVKIGPPNVLTDDEQARLAVLLKERTQDMGPQMSESERDAATILPLVMKRARVEETVLAGAEALKATIESVATPVTSAPTEPTGDTHTLKQIEAHTAATADAAAATADALAALNARAIEAIAKKAQKAKEED